MNKIRRKEIERACALLEEAKEILAVAAEDERSYYDAMPESIQSGDKGTKADEAADKLLETIDTIDEVIATAGETIE